MSESLKEKTVKGVGWSFVDSLSGSGIAFLVGLVLANLLTPSEYGIMAILTIFIAVSNSIVDSGFSNALIRKTDARRIDYNTVFFFNLLVSIVLYAVIYLAAPSISIFFKEPLLVEVMRVISLVLIINALAIIPRTLFVKEVNFKTQTKVSLIASVSSGVIGIGMALAGLGVWSLVGQQLSRQLLNTLFLWIYCRWRPVREFSVQSFKELFGFGSKLLLSGLLNTVFNEIYALIIGRCYTAAQLGQYTRANQFNQISSSNLTSVIQRVSYPVLSSIQDESDRLREGYRKIIKSTMLISFACMLGMAAVAKPMVVLLIGEKWLPAVGYLQIVCFSGMLYPLHAINLNILQVKGCSDLLLKLEIIKKIIGVGPLLLGIFFSIEYMLWGSVCTSVIAYFLNSYYSANLINYPTQEQIRDILPTFIVSFLIAAVMWSLTLLPLSNWLLLPLQCLLGIGMAVLIYERLHLPEYQEAKQLAFSFLKRKY